MNYSLCLYAMYSFLYFCITFETSIRESLNNDFISLARLQELEELTALKLDLLLTISYYGTSDKSEKLYIQKYHGMQERVHQTKY